MIQLVISDLRVAMLYFEQLQIAKVIYDVINHMNKYLMTYLMKGSNMSLVPLVSKWTHLCNKLFEPRV